MSRAPEHAHAHLAAAAGTVRECTNCHTPHGSTNIFLINELIQTPNSGTHAVVFNNLKGLAVGLKGKGDADITKTLKEGVVGSEGRATHPKMTKLSDDELQSVVKYIKQLGGL